VADPLTLSVLAVEALKEGIKFLYGQANELLKRRRERKDGKALADDPVQVPPDVPLSGALQPLRPDEDRLATLESELRELRNALVDYAGNDELIRNSDAELLRTADALRRVLEAVYQQRITFHGEQRPTSGPVVDGTIDVGQVSGYVAVVRARTVEGSANIRVQGRANEVSGTFIGAEIDRLG
jgi:hypothetical protein